VLSAINRSFSAISRFGTVIAFIANIESQPLAMDFITSQGTTHALLYDIRTISNGCPLFSQTQDDSI
jgi:hypothetical protein